MENNDNTQQIENQSEQEQQGSSSQENNNPGDDLIAENARLRLEYQRTKTALDKALKGKGEAEKNLRARMSAEEQETEAKRIEKERQDEELAELRKYRQTNEAVKRYLMQGMPAELASKAAEAEISGNMDALASIQKQHSMALIKSAQDEWLKSRPAPSGGSDDADSTPDDDLSDAAYYQRYYSGKKK